MESLKDKKKNISLYPRYKMLSWDFVFYYAIVFLFFTQTKGINAADVLFAESLYPIFKIIFLVPATILVEILGKRNSLIIGNAFVSFSIIAYISTNSLAVLILGEFLCAIGFIIKDTCESNLLYDSLEKNEKRGNEFSKIEGKGIAYYYRFEAITSIASGFLFVINGYIPMFLCLAVTVISTILSVKFRIVEDIDDTKKISMKIIRKECRNLLRSFRIFSTSPRLKNLIIFGALISAIFLSVSMLRSSIMEDIGVPDEYFGIIFAVMEILSAIASKNTNKFHKKYTNRTLTVLSIPLAVSFILIGVFCNLGLGYYFNLTIIIIALLIQYIARGPFFPLIKQYMNNFTTAGVRNKIASSYNLLQNLLRFVITFAASVLLRYTNTANTFLALGIVLGIVICLMLYNMRNKVGLKPEKYTEKDTKILDLK